MSKGFGKKSVTVMLSAALLGGVFVTVPNAINTTEVHADQKTSISYTQFLEDVAAMRAAVKQATPKVQNQLDSAYFNKLMNNPKKAYGTSSPSFMAAFQTIIDDAENTLDSEDEATSATNQDLNAITAVYDHFISRFTADDQDEITEGSWYIGYQDLMSDAHSGLDLSEDLDEFGTNFRNIFNSDISTNKITGIPASVAQVSSKKSTSTKKSTISKLSARKVSKKYVKVTGHATLHKKANYAHIKTYKGYRYAKLSNKGNFSKKIYAPKAKTVKVNAGYYSHGHFSAVTAAKTVHVK